MPINIATLWQPPARGAASLKKAGES